MSAYNEVTADLRDFLTTNIPLSVDRIFFDDFGGQAGTPPAPQILNPADSTWARVSMGAELPLPGLGGYGPVVRKAGSVTVQLFSDGYVDEQVSGLDVLVGQVESNLGYAIVGDCEFEAPSVIRVTHDEPSRHQINVMAPYTRMHRVGAVITEAGLPKNYVLPGHGFLVFNVVRPSGAGGWTKAQAVAPADTNTATAIVAVVDGDRVTLRFHGLVEGAHGLGSSGTFWLSQSTAGAITTVEPLVGGTIKQQLGKVVSSTQLLFAPRSWVEV